MFNPAMVKKSPTKEVVVGLLSFLIVWILDNRNMVLIIWTQNDCTGCMHKEKNVGSEQLSILFQEELAFLLSLGKPFLDDLEG